MFLFFISMYIGIPCLVSRIFRKRQADSWLTYLLTGGIIFAYTFLLMLIGYLLHPPVPGPVCSFEIPLVIVNTIMLLPASLVIQLISNYFVFRKYNAIAKPADAAS